MFNKIAIASAAVAAVGLARADDSYGSPLAPAYGAPAASYGAPAPSYGAPAPSYSAPAPAYGAPAEEYSASPDTSYNAPSYGAGEAELDLTPIIIGILVLTGLSLLFPTYVSLSTVRRKRSAGTQEVSGNSVVERVQDIYQAVLESEECMERVACEVGGLAADAGLSPKMFSMAAPFVPSKYSKMMKTFSVGKDCHKIKCGSIF